MSNGTDQVPTELSDLDLLLGGAVTKGGLDSTIIKQVHNYSDSIATAVVEESKEEESEAKDMTPPPQFDLESYSKQYPTLDVTLSFEKYKLYCKEKHRPLRDTGFNLWVRDDMNRGRNQKKITFNSSKDDGFDGMILRKCDCQSDVWVSKNLSEGNCEKCGSIFSEPD